MVDETAVRLLKGIHIMFRCLLILPTLAFALASGATDNPNKEYVPNIPSIKVNGETVPAEEIKRIYDYWVTVYKGPGKPLPNVLLDQLAKTSQSQAVARVAVRQYLEKNKLTLDPDAVKKDLEEYKERQTAEGRNFAEDLKSKKMTEQDFIDKEFTSRAGLTRATAAEVEKDMETVKKNFEKKKETMPLRRASQVRFTYEGSKYSRNDKRSKDEAKKLADFTLERLKKGADFAAVAKELSDDETSREKGGDLGWIAPNFKPKPVADAVYALAKAGDIAALVESEQGYHIVALTEMRSEEKAFQEFLRMHVYALTLAAETRLAKEAKVEEIK